jgi:regulator of sigma D
MSPPHREHSEAAGKSGGATIAATASDRRAGSRETVHKLLTERTEMFVLYCRLAGLAPYQEKPRNGVHQLLQEFCQVLVDYIAAGHFSLYERIISGNERRKEISNLASQIYPRIAETTEAALAFNDRYDTDELFELSASFHDELSQLGEQLATRIELEDKLLKLMS